MDVNQDFRNWTRTAAFSINVNEAAIRQLVCMLKFEEKNRADGHDVEEYGDQIFERSRVNYLMKRGLIRRCQPRYKGGERIETIMREGRPVRISLGEFRPGYENNYILTEAGTHLARLLNCAGYFAPAHIHEAVTS